MKWPFRIRKPRRKIPASARNRIYDPNGERLIGYTFDGEPIWAPRGHSLLLSPNGGGKSTCGAMPWLYSYLSTRAANRPAVLCLDSKNGEMADQAAPMIAEMGIPVAVIDDTSALVRGKWAGKSNPHRVGINPLSGIVETHRHQSDDVLFAASNALQALIPDPANDARNQYFRDQPKALMEFVIHALLKRNPALATPGGVWELISNPELLMQIARVEADEGDAMLAALARDVIGILEHEQGEQHRSAALKALKLFSAGSRLHGVGVNATVSHADLIRKRAVIFLVGRQALVNRLGPYYALHILAFTQALYEGAGPLAIIGDEFTNAPLKPLVESLTTLRAFGGEFHGIAQSRSEIERKFGKQETLTIEENAIVKQWFGFSSFEEAERVSKAMGEEAMISSNLGANEHAMRLQASWQSGKQRVMSPAELMAMPSHEALTHIKGFGFIHHLKAGMQTIDPYCHLIGENTLEGGILKPDPMITLHEPNT
ncbi:TraM recognition domain-containing protein [uncultured Hoeflea sp.]|uniref:type IV secretory system conjugative DNA transfer family protein n=1 Tax=uncultured Hoeflea sp. TaxID=538666 RepID=UPI002608AE0B|nr:TraM recognition domain-containing protein [uncultured Hoeflea sp.]